MNKLLFLASCAVSYQVGASLGHALGVFHGVKRADREWAVMLENGMVGPGLTHHPIRGA